MNKRLFPRMCLLLPLITSFLFMPVNTVNATGYSSDADFWRWWYIEHQTDAITDGQGASAENIQNTDSGQTAGTVIYNQSGVTRGDFIDYVEEQYNQAEEYLQKGVEYYVDAVNHVYDSTVTAGTKAAYQTQKAVREVVDSTGKVIVDVSGSDFWHSAYNGLFNNNGYKDIYTQNPDGSWNGTAGGYSFTFRYVTVGYYIRGTASTNNPLYNGYDSYSSGGTQKVCIFIFTCNGNTTYYIDNVRSDVNRFENIQVYTNSNYPKRLYFSYRQVYNNGNTNDTWNYITLSQNIGGTNSGTEPVLQPKQCGFIIDPSTGDRIPVYNDPSLNPFTVNGNGTVTDENGNDYPIYIDDKELTPDGWLQVLEYVDGEDQTQNPYNPQGKPWNTQDDGTVLGGLFSDLVSDISSIFDSIADKISRFFEGIIDKIVNALKKFIVEFIGDLDINTMTDLDVTNPFNLISECFDILLESLGVV